MNFLAHIYLSGDDRHLMLGNFIADHVKGKAFDSLSPEMQKGVLLHRKIDEFTDRHATVHLSKARLRPKFKKYAPVVADVFYNHFLAANWEKYSVISLTQFAEEFYQIAQANLEVMPDRTKSMLPYMINNNWLVKYASIEGIHNVMQGMARRTKFESGMENAAEELLKNYALYESEFESFFTELQTFTDTEIVKLSSK